MSGTSVNKSYTTELLRQLQLDLSSSFNKYLFGNVDVETNADFREIRKTTTPSDSFYENLSLGLSNNLALLPGVCNVVCEKRNACAKTEIVKWEKQNNVILPEDMKKFYATTDGYILYWSYQYAQSSFAANHVHRVGNIHIPHLSKITALCEIIETIPYCVHSNNNNSVTNCACINVVQFMPCGKIKAFTRENQTRAECVNLIPVMSPNTRIFEINTVNDDAKVCMIYENGGASSPKFYLVELNTLKLHFLAETFSEYLRMSLVHIGLPYWELLFANSRLPPWAEQLYLLLAPHLLYRREKRRSRLLHSIINNHSKMDYQSMNK